jgi:hypothetical protein
MAPDAFSVVIGFLAAVEAVLGAVALALGIRQARSAAGEASADRRPLLVLVAGALLGVSLVSWPLLYLLLAGWVPRWPGIMCVEGVRRIGTGSLGAAGLLPSLIAALDVSRLLVVFGAGAWAVLRRVPGAAAARRAAIAAAALGVLAIADGGLAFAYVAIPKREIPPEAGCCTMERRGAVRDAGLSPAGAAGEEGRSGLLPAAFIAGTALMGAGAGLLRVRGARGRAGAAALGALAVLAAASAPVASRFLSDVAAPAVLGLPHHRCAWCAFARAPETIVGAALWAGAALCAGWALVARLGAGEGSPGTPGADTGAPPILGPLLAAASFGFLGTAAMAAVLVSLR